MATTAETNEQYHASEGVSCSQLKLLDESPQEFYETYITKTIVKEESDAMRFGTLFHAAILEPHTFQDSFITMPDFAKHPDNRTDAGKLSTSATG